MFDHRTSLITTTLLAFALITPFGCSEDDDKTNDPVPVVDPDPHQTTDPGQTGQDPAAQACHGVPDTGVCSGSIVKYCENNSLKTYDCALEHKICGHTHDTSFGCIDSASDSDKPSTTDLVTAEDWARARIAGKVSSHETFNAVAYSTGFPVQTDDNTLIFMHWFDGGDWYVAGDFNHWGENDADKVHMTKLDDIWYAEVPMPTDAAQNGFYKFVNAQDNSYHADPWALRYTYTEDGEISLITKPASEHIMRWNDFKSPQGLQNRTVRAYIPDGAGPFDVIYAHDGQNLFGDRPGSWQVEKAMHTLHAKFVVVGIDNTSDRMSEYSFSTQDLACTDYGVVQPSGDKYAQFVQESVRPFIESQIATTSKAALMGSSLGGLISLYTAHLYPTAYKAVLAFSPTTAWGRFDNDHGQTIEDLYVAAGHRNFLLYLDNGGHEPDGGCGNPLGQRDACIDEVNTDTHDNFCYTRSFVDAMANKAGYTWNVDLFHYFDEGAGHNEGAWSYRIGNAENENNPLKLFMRIP